MNVGDLVKVITNGISPVTGGVGLITRTYSTTDNHTPPVFYCWVQMAEPGSPVYKFRAQHLEVVS